MIMSVVQEIMWPCTPTLRSIRLSIFQPSASSTERTPSSAAYRSRRSGTGAAVDDAAHTAPPPNVESIVRGATEGRWTSRLTLTSWASIWATATSLTRGGTCSCCQSSALMTGQGFSQELGARCPRSCPHRASSAFSVRDAPK